MSNEALTPDEFLRLSESEIEQRFEDSLPASTSNQYFIPEQYSSVKNADLVQMKKWKVEYAGKAAERKTIMTWTIPMLLVGPGLISLIFQGFNVVTAMIFTGGAMLIVGFAAFFGRVWGWEAKRYERNVGKAEKTVEKVRNKRAREWAESRYDFNTDQVEWNEFSNFYIMGKGYQWKEVADGQFIIVEVDTKEEPPLLPAKK